nr:MAG TPA: Class II bacteriocin [Caudoviricetes sp.]
MRYGNIIRGSKCNSSLTCWVDIHNIKNKHS